MVAGPVAGLKAIAPPASRRHSLETDVRFAAKEQKNKEGKASAPPPRRRPRGDEGDGGPPRLLPKERGEDFR